MKAEKALKTASPVEAKSGDENDWEAEDYFNTLERAERIRQDSEKMKRVSKVAGRKMKAAQAINSLADIKLAAKNLRKRRREGLE